MVILGGLELVVGGYIVHKYHKSKNEKKRLEQEAQQRRHNTFPGEKPQSWGPYPPPQQPMTPISPQQTAQKYACYAPPPQPQPQFHHMPQHMPRPHTAQPPHSSGYAIPRRPLPQQQPQLIQPLQRSDSFATISRMPIANGSRPQDIPDDAPILPPRRHASNMLPVPQQQPQNSPYSQGGFSVSTPALAPQPTSPMGFPTQGRRQTVDDNWETYAPPGGYIQQQPGHAQQPAHGHPHYAPTVSTALGEDDPNDPPPPYRP